MNFPFQLKENSELHLQKTGYSFSASVIAGLSILLDGVSILLPGIVSYLYLVGISETNVEVYLSAVIFICILNFMIFHYAGLYQFEAIMQPDAFWDKLVVAFATSFFLLLAIAFSLKVSDSYSRIWMSVFAATAGSSILILRLCVYWLVKTLLDSGVFVRNVVVIGGGDKGRRLLDHIAQRGPKFISVVGVFDTRMALAGKNVAGYPILGGLDALESFTRTQKVDDIIIALPSSAEDEYPSIIERIRQLPVNLYLGSDLVGFQLTFRPAPSHYRNLPMVEIIDKPISGWNIALKYGEDIFLAVLILIAFTPVMLIIALAVKLDGPGPVLFRQKRLGFNNKVFQLYKFRSMRDTGGSDHITVQAKRNDERITRVGRFIRRTSLDELPQLFNVLRGTMSLVGPRPHAVDHNEMYSKKIRGYFARHRVKPGITGWAQVKGLRGETDVLEKMEARVKHDIYYAENWSLIFDLKILVMTAIVCLLGKNAY